MFTASRTCGGDYRHGVAKPPAPTHILTLLSVAFQLIAWQSKT